jgi:hypothetical protein
MFERAALLNVILRTAWERWRIIARINGDYVARFITNLFFFTILVPFAIVAKLFTDPLGLRQSAASHWKTRKSVGVSIDEARSQF